MPTDDFGDPYPALTDQPNGPAAFLALVNNLSKYPRGRVGHLIGPAGSNDIQNSDGTLTLMTLPVPVVAGRTYRIRATVFGGLQITAPGAPLLRVALSGVSVNADFFRPYWLNLTVPASGSGSTAIENSGERDFDATATGTLNVVLSASQNVVGGAYRTGTNSHEISVYDMGASS